jgi:hypothetical protein
MSCGRLRRVEWVLLVWCAGDNMRRVARVRRLSECVKTTTHLPNQASINPLIVVAVYNLFKVVEPDFLQGTPRKDNANCIYCNSSFSSLAHSDLPISHNNSKFPPSPASCVQHFCCGWISLVIQKTPCRMIRSPYILITSTRNVFSKDGILVPSLSLSLEILNTFCLMYVLFSS